MISDDEKIATIGKLAIHCPIHQGNSYCYKIPDMFDLSNLMKILEGRESYELKKFNAAGYECILDPVYTFNGVMDDYSTGGIGETTVEAIRRALLMLYEMENM